MKVMPSEVKGTAYSRPCVLGHWCADENQSPHRFTPDVSVGHPRTSITKHPHLIPSWPFVYGKQIFCVQSQVYRIYTVMITDLASFSFSWSE